MLVALPAAAAPSVHATGLTRCEPDRAWNGCVPFTGQARQAHLADINGREVKQ